MAEDTTAALTVQRALANVLADLPAIAKTGRAPANMGGYAFRRIEDITAALKPLFAQHGILVIPQVRNRIETERATRGGGVMFCVDLEIAFRFVGVDGDELQAVVWGQGTDSGDKATQKAVTSAFKTMLSVVFCISDSELDAEAHDVPQTEPKPKHLPARPERVAEMRQLVQDADLGDWVRQQGYEWPWSEEECRWIEVYAQNQPGPNARQDPDPAATTPPTQGSSEASQPVPADAQGSENGNADESSGSDAGAGKGRLSEASPPPPAPARSEPEKDSTAQQRRTLGIMFKELVANDIILEGDKAEIIGMLTQGRTTTSTEITFKEAVKLVALGHMIEQGAVTVVDGDDSRRTLHAERQPGTSFLETLPQMSAVSK